MSAGNVPFNQGGQGNVPFPGQMPSNMGQANYPPLQPQPYPQPAPYQPPPGAPLGYDSYGAAPPGYRPDYDMEKNSEETGSHGKTAEVRKHKLTTKGMIMLVIGPGVLFYFSGFATAIVFLKPIVTVAEALREGWNSAAIGIGAYWLIDLLWPKVKWIGRSLWLKFP